MKLGIVSNSWRKQLGEGIPLELLIERAQREGYLAIELRQGCLGEFETAGDLFPIADRLGVLSARFPQIQFNIAIAFPFFNPFECVDFLFEAGLSAAVAVAGFYPAHLRMVDVTSEHEQFITEFPDFTINTLVEQTLEASDRQTTLSLENGKQKWRRLRKIIELVRRELDPIRPTLQLCYDACNLLQATDRPDTKQVIERLKASDLAMIHFKQARAGEIQLTVCDGGIDWRHQLACLQDKGYAGPALFELPPHERIWDHLRESREYLDGLGLKLN